MLATRPGCSHTGARSLADEIAFELGDGADNVEQQTPAGRRRIDGLGKGAEADGFGSRRVTICIRCARLRPNRSSFQTTSTSPAASACSALLSSTRSVSLPLTPSSRKISSQPAAVRPHQNTMQHGVQAAAIGRHRQRNWD